jgi:MFS transporter, MHS family, proline/betaine transporter
MATQQHPRFVTAIVFGNALEWFDFIVYGYFAIPISKQFFPNDSHWAGLISTFAIFGVPFFVRPFAGIAFGYTADRIGRKPVLVTMMGSMALGSAIIGLAPNFAWIGSTAPIVILVGRVVQGLSVGGEFASATALLFEGAPRDRRGLYSSWQFSGQGAAIVIAAIMVTAITRSTTPEQLEAWGWRLPFLIGAFIGPIGVYIRLNLSESAAYLEDRSRLHPEQRPASRRQLGNVLIGTGLVAGATASVYVLMVFMPTYAVKVLRFDVSSAAIGPLVAGLAVTIGCPIAGWLSDRLGRKPLLVSGEVLLFLALYPGFILLRRYPSVVALGLIELTFGLLISIYAGPLSAVLCEAFPTGIRSTAMSIAYNLSVALFGGLAPFTVSWLVASTGDEAAPAYYVMLGLTLSLAATFGVKHDGARIRLRRSSAVR